MLCCRAAGDLLGDLIDHHLSTALEKNQAVSSMEMNDVCGLLRIRAVLGQLRKSGVHADFLAGHVLHVDNREKLLEMLNAMDDLLFPEWIPNTTGLLTLLSVASNHLHKLFNSSSEVFEIPLEKSAPLQLSYASWMHTLNNLVTSEYWSVTGENRFLGIKSVGTMEVTDRNVISPLNNKKTAGVVFGRPTGILNNSSNAPKRKKTYCFPEGSEECLSQRLCNIQDLEIYDSSDAEEEEELSSDSDSEGELNSPSNYIPKDVVTPQVFQESGKQTLRFFLRRFERFFKLKYHGNERDCSQELGKYLSGKAKEAYDVLGGAYLKYSDMKVALLQWYSSCSAGNINHHREGLRRVAMKNGESFTLYCMRLHSMANRAFPHNARKCYKQLKHQLALTVPECFVKIMEEKEELKVLSGTGKKLSWQDIMEIATKLDKKNQKDNLFKNEPQEKSRMLNAQAKSQKNENGIKEECMDYSSTIERNSMRRHSRLLQCQYCGRRGHVEKQCWLQLGACTICGSQSHRYKECSNYLTAKCSRCFGPHLGKDCKWHQA